MRRLAYLFFTLLLICCSQDNIVQEDVFDNGGKNEGKGSYPIGLSRTISQGGTTREYILKVPESYTSDTTTPLLINFHGYGGSAFDYQQSVGGNYGLDALADNENFFVAYPQAAFRQKGANYWEPGDNGGNDIGLNDVYFVTQLIADIGQDYNIDTARIYAVGYSNGGMMAYSLACSRGDLFAAIGVMSGTMLAEDCNQDFATSVVAFHGIGDEVLPYDGNQDYQSASSDINYWLNHNNISPSSLITTALNNDGVKRDVYSGGTDDTSVVLYTIYSENNASGGHVWFSAPIEGKTPNKILWDFLSQYSL